MMTSKRTISNKFFESLNNAFGSRHNFEKELIYKAYQYGNKGKIYFKMNHYLNFYLSREPYEDNDYVLLTCNLDICDIFNFIEDIDYSKLSHAYIEIRSLIESK